VSEVRKAQGEHKVTTRFSAEMIAWLLIYIGLGYGVVSSWEIPGHGRDPASGAHVVEVISRLLVGRDVPREVRVGGGDGRT
jgi:hypothetical protein